MVKVEVSKIIQSNFDHEDGSRLYHLIRDQLSKNESIELDFSNVDIMPSSFLNTSFRLLALDYEYSFLRDHIAIKNSNSFVSKMIKASIITEE